MSAFFVWQTDFDMHFESARPKDSLVQKIFPISHANNNDIIQSLHTIDIREKLVDNLVINIGSTRVHASLFTNRIDLIENDNV